jgi:hypothetical protein
MAKRGRRGTGKALVTKSKLFQVEGMDDVIKEISRTMDRVTAERLKAIYVEAAIPIWSQVKRNIAKLYSGPVQNMLDSMVMITKGKPKKQHVLSGMSQAYGIKQMPTRLKKGGQLHRLGNWKVWNPYWWEFGTKERKIGYRHWKWGWFRGRIKPTPFFRPAVEEKKSEVRDILVRELRRVIEDVGK